MKRLFILCITFVATISLMACNNNPLIGKWQATRGGEMLKMIGCTTTEYTKDKEISCGMAENVTYEINDNQIIVTGAFGLAVIHTMQDENKMITEVLGDKILWERVK